MSSGTNGYALSRAWFNFAWENPDIVTPCHGLLFLWLVEINNRSGWSEKFQITAKECMGGMLCKSHNTYIKCLNDLIKWKFVILIKKSQNQHQCNIVALSKFDTSQYKALDKALAYHVTDHLTEHLTYSKTTNKETKKPLTLPYSGDYENFYRQYPRKVGKKKGFDVWQKLSETDRLLCDGGVKRYAKSVIGKEEKFIAHPATWLNGRRWEDEEALAEEKPKLFTQTMKM